MTFFVLCTIPLLGLTMYVAAFASILANHLKIICLGYSPLRPKTRKLKPKFDTFPVFRLCPILYMLFIDIKSQLFRKNYFCCNLLKLNLYYDDYIGSIVFEFSFTSPKSGFIVYVSLVCSEKCMCYSTVFVTPLLFCVISQHLYWLNVSLDWFLFHLQPSSSMLFFLPGSISWSLIVFVLEISSLSRRS